MSSPAPYKVQDSDPVYIIREHIGFLDLLGVWAILELRIAYKIHLNYMIYLWENVGNVGKSLEIVLYNIIYHIIYHTVHINIKVYNILY